MLASVTGVDHGYVAIKEMFDFGNHCMRKHISREAECQNFSFIVPSSEE